MKILEKKFKQEYGMESPQGMKDDGNGAIKVMNNS